MIIDMYMGHYHHHPNCSAATSSRHGLGLGTATREEIGFRLISLRESQKTFMNIRNKSQMTASQKMIAASPVPK
jgi:hypothetical protein